MGLIDGEMDMDDLKYAMEEEARRNGDVLLDGEKALEEGASAVDVGRGNGDPEDPHQPCLRVPANRAPTSGSDPSAISASSAARNCSPRYQR